jgi:hypothetical protein
LSALWTVVNPTRRRGYTSPCVENGDEVTQ